MESKDKSKGLPELRRAEKYVEAGVQGNDQNEAVRSEGHAEHSERGMTEFHADAGKTHNAEDYKPDCQHLSDNGKKKPDSERGETEFP